MKYFKSAAEFHEWLQAHHDSEPELILGFYKKRAPHEGITYREALDEALSFGWIDGVRRTVDEHRYSIRFTPRQARSKWSAVNSRRASELIEEGRMQPPGRQAFEQSDPERHYSYENRQQRLPQEYEERFRRHPEAWAFFAAQPPGYRKTATFWVVSAKKEETRLKRLATLIEDSANERRLAASTYERKQT